VPAFEFTLLVAGIRVVAAETGRRGAVDIK
jgi:hypothetical protein